VNDQDKEYLRDLSAMFKSVTGASPEDCYKFADEMLEARKAKPEEEGILAIKPTKKTIRKG
jgi:hypothetical protein